MAFKMQQFKCKKCGHEFEALLDSRTPNEPVLCDGEVPAEGTPRHDGLEFQVCASTDVEPILSVSSSRSNHRSWGSWRV